MKASLVGKSGIIQCCLHAPHVCLPVTCKCCQSFASVTINVTDMSDYLIISKHFDTNPVDSKLLHEPITRDMLSHEPYTPESADSHSPNPEKTEEVHNESRRSSVSPLQLKSRLENIIRTSQSPKALIKRSASQDVVLNGRGEHFRQRTMSETTKRTSRPRLIISESINSMMRLQSHHSSSGEDWFEFDENSNSRNDFKEDCLSKGIGTEIEMNEIVVTEKPNIEQSMQEHTKERKKNLCCCILM